MHIGYYVAGWPASLRASGIVTYIDAIKREVEAMGHEVSIFSHEVDAACHEPNVYRVDFPPPDGFWKKVRNRVLGKGRADEAVHHFGQCIAREVAKVHAVKPLDVFEIEESFGWFTALIDLNRFPVVVRLHGPTFLVLGHQVGQDARVDERVEREGAALRRAKFITAPNHCTLDATLKRYALKPLVGRAIPNPYPIPADAPTAFQEVPGDPVLLFIGRFDLIKGADLLLQAFEQLAKRHATVRLVMAGPGVGIPGPDGLTLTFQEYLAQHIDPAVHPRIEYLGPQTASQVRSLRSRATVTLMTSRWENQPYALLEAMALWSPVVVFATGGIAEMVEHGRNGLAVPLANVDEFAGQIERLILDPGLRRELADEGFEYVSSVHGPQRVAAGLVGIYFEALHAVG